MRKSTLIFCLALAWLIPVKVAAQLSCNNWLYTPSLNSVFSIGDLDIPGDKITVEAVINRTTPYSTTSADDNEGDVVSKHNSPSDVNYLLRPNHAYVTTTNGFFATPDICEIELNKTYHIAMVYDGNTLKFYRDGYLMSQVNASGDLFQNNWNTRIGLYDPAFWRTQFVGYVNEVRIWNVARSQAELRTYMNSSLPNPAAQTGLKAYYTFDDLTNKQGNTVFNGTLGGNASINNTNTSCTLRVDSCAVLSSGCNNWLHIPNYNTQDYVAIGDLDMTGDKITVEAEFAADTNYFIPSTISYDLVSKHTGPSDCNYLLRPVTAEITTTNGFFQVIACDYKPRKINHAALVYDGTTLKFYRNGFLMGSKPASGNLVTNNLITKIGNYAAGTLNGSLKGFMNEVRIWNIARTQDEIKTYMNNPLPNPATQPGLVAYYQFDNLQNKQGNTAWNGTLNGAASINNTIPDCNFYADSCTIISQSQTCNGSFGNPVVNITFGSGSTNPGPSLSTVVTGASTDYNYATYATGTPPTAPVDGDYALINQVPVNSAWYSGGTDHTGNANGYMAFFNSAPTPGNFYRQTVNDLCPGTTYEFSAWIANVINPSVLPAAILPNITFKILDPVTQAELAVYNTGNIPNQNSMLWKQYSFLFTMPAGNTSVTLLLSNNNIGGSAQPGNDLAIDDITFRPCGPLTKASFSPTVQIDSTGITSCTSVSLFGNITGSFNSPSYQWQISSDGGNTFTDVPGAFNLNAVASGLSNGQYTFRLLSAESGNLNSPNCRFISNLIKLTVTSCSNVTGISRIINYYTPAIAFDPCTNKITVEDGSGFKTGDTLLIIQMKGAVIDSSNTASFGSVTNYKNAGNYEFNYVRSVTGNIVQMNNVLLKQYDIPVGKVQLIRVPYYQHVTVTDTLTCLPWDGKKGGVLVFNVQDTLELQANMDVEGKGFRGGIISNNPDGLCGAGSPGFFYPLTQPGVNPWQSGGAEKGEGIAEMSDSKKAGKGRLANGGGGGNKHNFGGAGGGNYGAGGTGGDALQGCGVGNGGVGGAALSVPYNNQKIFLGGGGGRGDDNNGVGTVGKNGGGIVIVSAGTMIGNNYKISANGASQLLNGTGIADGAGGGGGGGAVLLQINNYPGNLTITSAGGNGGNQLPTFGCAGTGGGGGGGFIGISNAVAPAGISTAITGGNAGIVNTIGLPCSGTTYGATNGTNGDLRLNYQLPVSSVLFVKNIDSVRIKDSLTNCRTFDFKGLAYTNTSNIQTWQWTFGDNGTASTQNTSHTYAAAGNYTVKLVATDINGCKDSITKVITVAACTISVKIINTYAAAVTIDPCTNTIKVDDPSTFNAGDTVVIMQMKGASIDSNNTNNFGTVSAFNNAGKFEFNYVKSKTGNTIEFKNTFLNQYDALRGRVQLIRVPYYSSYTVTDTLSCPAWDGTKGGVVILNSASSITLRTPIDVSNKGFRGGAVGGGFSCSNISNWAAPTGIGGTKGEGIAEYITGFEAGGARLANGGGGAYAANSGGGGGGNWGAGGLGGFHSNTCPSPTQSMNGQGLTSLIPQNFFLGGGGGGGQEDNGQPVAAGGNGGGMVIIKASTLNSNDQSIFANGESVSTLVRDEGGAGGGAGGTVLLYVNNYTDTLYTYMNGGDGSSNDNTIYPTRCHGPGGGGGGGQLGIATNGITAPASLQAFINGGIAGKVLNPQSACANTTNGATNGESGAASFNLVVPEATVPFKKNIDSVRISDQLTSCKTFNFSGQAYTNTSPIQKWQWNFGDGTKDTLQNTTHTYTNYGPRTVKLIVTDGNGCKDSTTKVVTTRGLNYDFIFEQDICDPLKVQFTAVGDTTSNIYWSHGDGIFTTTIRNPLHYYPGPGSYSVEYCSGNPASGCIDTVKKTIFVGWHNDNIIITPDTTICFGAAKQLRSNIDSTLRFCWNPVSFLNNPNFANPITSTPSTITYGLNSDHEDNNLVVNGNFSNGNTGFSSDYDSSSAPLSIAEYFVGTSSLTAGPSTADCRDHTNGNGNMLIAQCNFSSTAQVWGQTVTIQPNTNYTFSAWVQSLAQPNTALLRLYINGNAVTDPITLFDPACTWKKYAVNWNSGSTTSVDLSIVHISLVPGIGGYFAIDDIKLAAYDIKRETITITVDTPNIDTRTDTAICAKQSVQLNTTGAVSYIWSPAAGLSNASVANPVASPADTTKYIVTGTNAFGCVAKDSVIISIKPLPVITRTGDTLVCRNTAVPLFASGGISYLWSPSAGLNNPTSPTPVATPVNNSKYYVTVTGANNCSNRDSVTITLQPVPVFKVSASQSVCLNQQARLNASGGNYYLWSPALLVSNASVANPLSTTTQNTLYSVLIKDTVCNYDTTLTTNITVLPLPTVTASKSNDINCAIGSAVLTANGALQYNWTPARGLDDATIASPVASPVNTTAYTVTGTSADGCSNTASVTVIADYSTKVSYSVPNAFSPNGDGKNECFRVKYFGLIQDLQLTIFNRWGERVFYTTNPNDCWDGTYKGNPCDAGNFVYYIKAKTTCGPVERKGNVVLVR